MGKTQRGHDGVYTSVWVELGIIEVRDDVLDLLDRSVPARGH